MVLVCGTASTVSLPAQVCAGFPSLRDSHFRLAVSVASHTYATAFRTAFTTGRSVYGTLGIGRTRDVELDASTFDIDLEAGADLSFGERRVALCPLAALKVSLGPYDFLLSQTDFLYMEGRLGLGAAAVIRLSPRLTVLPTGGFRAARLTLTERPSPGQLAGNVPRRSRSDLYWLLSFGMGFVFDDVLTIRPGVTVPFGLPGAGAPNRFVVPFGVEERELSLDVSVGYSFGNHSRAASREPRFQSSRSP